MQGDSGQHYAVVMGDLVHSGRAPAPEVLHDRFNAAVEAGNRAHAAALASPLTITLGDEFQGLVRSLAGAVPLVLGLRLALMSAGIDCRFVIGRVEIRTPLNRERAWNMMGPGLARARERLNEKAAGVFYRFSIEEAPLTETLLDALGAGLSVIERGWTDRQRDDIAALLGGLSAGELAQRRNVSVHSVYKVRGAGNYDAYVEQWQAIEAALEALDAGSVPG